MESRKNKKLKFSLEGGTDVPIYEAVGFHPERWNGWLVPIVSHETAKRIADDLFDPNWGDEQPSYEILDCITHAKENFEETVEVGCGICWFEVSEQGENNA